MKTAWNSATVAVILGIALLASGAAWAGKVTTAEVTITTSRDHTTAYGNPRDVRYSPDDKQLMGCQLFASASYADLTCWALDQFGQGAQCSLNLTDPGFW